MPKKRKPNAKRHFNPLTKKSHVYKHPYTDTQFKIYKKVIKSGVDPRDVLPAGVTYKNGRLYIEGTGSRKQKINTLIQKSKFQNNIRAAQDSAKADRKAWRALATKLKADNATFRISNPINRKAFDMVDVYLQLNNPTSDHEKVLSMLRQYIDKRINDIKGRSLYMEFVFDDYHLRYFTGEITDFSKAKFARLREKVEQWTEDKDGSDPKHEQYKMKGIRLLISVKRGGGLLKFPHLYSFDRAKLRSKVYCPVVTGNNCLIDCLHQYKENSRRTAKGKVRIHNAIRRDDPSWAHVKKLRTDYDAIRTQLGIPLGSTIETGGKAWNALMDHFNLNADVYVVRKGKFVRYLSSTISERGDRILLWLHGGHYHVVLNPGLVQYEHCQDCGHWVQGKDHTCNKEFCKSCKCNVVKGKAHNCAVNQESKNKKLRYIQPAQAHDEFTATTKIVRQWSQKRLH